MVWAAEGQLLFRKTAVTASGEPPRLLLVCLMSESLSGR